MATNSFEGARRIAKLVAALWILGWIVAAFTSSSSVWGVTYQIAGPGAVPIRVESGCDTADDASESLSRTTSKGTYVALTLCFKHSVFDDGRKLIPYLLDKGTYDDILESKIVKVRGNEKYSTDVLNYTRSVASSFKLSKSDEEWIDAQGWSVRLKEFGWGALWVIGGLVFIWGFSLAVGWIVRGFRGIPQGQDRREEKG